MALAGSTSAGSKDEFAIVLNIRARVRLTPDEFNPWLCVFTTTDMKTTPSFIEAKVPETDDGTVTCRIEFVVDVSKVGLIGMDTSVCVQAYCNVYNDCNELCSHKCGYAATTVNSIMRTDGGRIKAKMHDVGLFGMGNRGAIELAREKPHGMRDAFDVFVSLVGVSSPFDFVAEWSSNGGSLARARRYVSSYRLARTKAVVRALPNPIDDNIAMFMLPDYVQSCGSVTPPSTFLMVKEPPPSTEDYCLLALDAAMTRSKRFACIPTAMRMGTLKNTHVDHVAGVLVGMAMSLCLSCPYLFDRSISSDGGRLVACDEFSRMARISKATDCEDSTFEACIFTSYILTNTGWGSEIMNLMRAVRACYVSTISLKAVSSPARSMDNANEGDGSAKRFASHACCDLIPLNWLITIIESGRSISKYNNDALDVIRAIAKERASLIASVEKRNGTPTMVIVAEGTGIVQSVVHHETETCKRWMRNTTAKLFNGTFENVKLVAYDDLNRRDAPFYKYTMSSLIHDVLFSNAAETLCRKLGKHGIATEVVYGYFHKKSVVWRGVPHWAFVTLSSGVVAASAPPMPERVWNVSLGATKFEQPVPPLGPVNLSEVTRVINEIDTIIEEALGGVKIKRECFNIRKVVDENRGQNASHVRQDPKCTVIACIPIANVTRKTASLFSAYLVADERIVSVAWKTCVLMVDVGLVVFHVEFIDA